MNDMRAVIVPKSDQINADDLLAGPMTITITQVAIGPGTEQPVSIYYDGDNGKPYKPCKSMARVMVHCWGPNANEYVGRSMTLYCDPTVRWGGMEVGGIRISHMTHIQAKQVMALTATKGSRKPFTVHPLELRQPRRTIADALDDLSAQLQDAPDRTAVDEILASETVQKIEAHVKGEAAERLQAMKAAALERTAPSTDSSDFPGDKP